MGHLSRPFPQAQRENASTCSLTDVTEVVTLRNPSRRKPLTIVHLSASWSLLHTASVTESGLGERFMLSRPDLPVSAGNGPSGICLSYLLSGYIPYVKPGAVHPHPLLQRKLTEAPGVSILDQVGLTLESRRAILLAESQGSLEDHPQNRGVHKTVKQEKNNWDCLPRPANAMSAV